MSSFRWICPHCEHAAIITPDQVEEGSVSSRMSSGDGAWLSHVKYILCPNPHCKLTTIQVTVGSGSETSGRLRWHGKRRRIQVRPATYSRPIPEYVPAAVREDYEEACAIVELSPKSSATLARRALQGMIRHFHGIAKRNLFEEIQALQDRVDPLTWKAIDAVRGVGNIGAHMENDIDTIVEVEPDEALKLIRLIELLIKDWYVAKHNREKDLAAIIELNADKQERRSAGPDVQDAGGTLGKVGEDPTPTPPA